MMNKIYTGIGSRRTPEKVCLLMTRISRYLSNRNWVLRSGGANGADTAFENGADKKQIFLPWKNFNNNNSPFFNIDMGARRIASEFHPNWNSLSHGAKCLHARNVYQVLGLDLDSPSQFVICWTSDGKPSGGTGQAIRIAQAFEIPVYNLYNQEDVYLLSEKLKSLLTENNP